MTLIIETGAIVTGSNSYITEAEFSTYLTDRGYTVTATVEPLLIRSFDYMGGLNWILDHDYAYTVTAKMKRAQCEIAYRFSTGLDPFAQPEAGVKSEAVDVIRTEYFGSSAGRTGTAFLSYMPQAKAYLKDLIYPSDTVGRH